MWKRNTGRGASSPRSSATPTLLPSLLGSLSTSGPHPDPYGIASTRTPSPPATPGWGSLQPPFLPRSPLGGPARMGKADRREAHGSGAAGPQVWGRDELEHRHGGWGPPAPPSPTRARNTTTRCKQRRLPRPSGGGGRPGRQPVRQRATAGARPAHMPSPGARDGEEGAPSPRGKVGDGPARGTAGSPSPCPSPRHLPGPPLSWCSLFPHPRSPPNCQPLNGPRYSHRSQPSCGVGAPGSG